MSASERTKPRPRLSREQSRQRLVGAATELVRERSYAEISVSDVTERAGIERTIFYRHFDNLVELLMSVGRGAIEELYEAQQALAKTRAEHGPEAIRQVIELAVDVFAEHGPVIRAVLDAAATEFDGSEQERMRQRFDELAAAALRTVPAGERRFDDVEQTARALNILNERYLLDAFGGEPRVSRETAIRTLSDIWIAVLGS